MEEKLVEVITDKERGYGVLMTEKEAELYLKSMPKIEDKQVKPKADKAVKKDVPDTESEPVIEDKKK